MSLNPFRIRSFSPCICLYKPTLQLAWTRFKYDNFDDALVSVESLSLFNCQTVVPVELDFTQKKFGILWDCFIPGVCIVITPYENCVYLFEHIVQIVSAYPIANGLSTCMKFVKYENVAIYIYI